jgi:hypothetical protein
VKRHKETSKARSRTQATICGSAFSGPTTCGRSRKQPNLEPAPWRLATLTTGDLYGQCRDRSPFLSFKLNSEIPTFHARLTLQACAPGQLLERAAENPKAIENLPFEIRKAGAPDRGDCFRCVLAVWRSPFTLQPGLARACAFFRACFLVPVVRCGCFSARVFRATFGALPTKNQVRFPGHRFRSAEAIYGPIVPHAIARRYSTFRRKLPGMDVKGLRRGAGDKVPCGVGGRRFLPVAFYLFSRISVRRNGGMHDAEL